MTREGVDDFAKPNQSGLGTSLIDGQTWVEVRSVQILSIVSNQGNATNSGSSYCVVVLGSKTPKDVDMRIRFAMGASGDSFGLTTHDIDINDFYYFNIGNQGQKLEIGKDVSGVFTSLATTAFAWSTATYYIIHVRTVGTTMMANVWADGSAESPGWMLSITDSSLTTGQFGISCFPSTSTAIKFDSFIAYDYINTDDSSISDIGGLQQWGVDSNTVSDIGGTQQWGVDGLSISDLGGTQQWGIDGNTATDAGTFTDNANLVDSVSIADIGGLQAWMIDALTASDVLLASDNALLTDNGTISDASLQTGTFGGVDALIASDSALYTGTANLVDALVISDSLSINGAFSGIELLVIVDASVFSVSLITIDTLSLSDIGNLQQWIIDALIASDIGNLQQWGMDSLVVGDNALFIDDVLFVDLNTISDSGGLQSNSIVATATIYVIGHGRDGIATGYSHDGLATGKGA